MILSSLLLGFHNDLQKANDLVRKFITFGEKKPLSHNSFIPFLLLSVLFLLVWIECMQMSVMNLVL